MAAMPYLAVYAASLEFWGDHPEWALYDAENQPITFHDFLGLMDPSQEGGWIEHLLTECRSVLEKLPFDGLHVDQYGDPKEGFNAKGEGVDIPEAFAAFIRTLKEEHHQAAVVFNAVGNWPIEQLAAAPQDFVYIEIWPPDVTYRDVGRIVRDARGLSGGKGVVIALYLPANRPENILLADAFIFSLGGSRIEMGEKARLLVDPYFPKHEAISRDLMGALRRYHDFAVRYGRWLGPSAELLKSDEVPSVPEGVWAVIRSCPGWVVVCLVNGTGLEDPRWDEEQPAPVAIRDVPVRLSLDRRVRKAWWASADELDPGLVALSHTVEGGAVSCTLPVLERWAIIALELVGVERYADG
jgi:dextranase